MRSLWLIGTGAALLAGCATGETGGIGERNAAEDHSSHAASAHPPASEHAHSHGASAHPAAPTQAHSHVDSVPAAYHGVYDGSLEACARRGVERLTVSARELRFHESVGTVRSVGYGGPGAISVEADYEGEGRRWRGLRIFSLNEDGSRLTVKGDGGDSVRVRCPAGAP